MIPVYRTDKIEIQNWGNGHGLIRFGVCECRLDFRSIQDEKIFLDFFDTYQRGKALDILEPFIKKEIKP